MYFCFDHVFSLPLHSFFDLFPYTQSSLPAFSWSFINRYPINTYTTHELYSKDSFGKTVTWFPNPTNPASVWSFKVNNENTTAFMISVQGYQKETRTALRPMEVVIISLLSHLNRLCTLLWCFFCWLGTSKCWLRNLMISIYKGSPPEMFSERPCRSGTSIKLLWNFIEIPLQHGCFPVNLLLIFRTTSYKNTYGEMFLNLCYFEK